MQKKVYLDFVRALACILVILQHCSFEVLQNTQNTSDFLMGNILDSISRMCIPLFLILTGLLVFSKKAYKKGDILKRIKKVFPDFLFLAIALYVLRYENAGAFTSSLKDIPKMFFVLPELHLWYIYMLIPAYFFLPIFSGLRKNVPLKDIKPIFALFIAFAIFRSLSPMEFFKYGVPFMSVYIYILYGAYFKDMKSVTKKRQSDLIITAITVTGMIAVGTQALFRETGELIETLYLYDNILVFLQAITVFNLIYLNRDLFEKSSKPIQSTLGFISKHSYILFLSHYFFLDLVVKANIFNLNSKSIIPNTILTFVFSLSFSFLYSKAKQIIPNKKSSV